jgi:hypothetical protein
MKPNDVGWQLALLIISTVVATGLFYRWAKRQGWMPPKGKPTNRRVPQDCVFVI